MGTSIPKDEWTPTLRKLSVNMSRAKQRRMLGKLGVWIVARVQGRMRAQKGFGDGAPYAALKIKWRYHGRKQIGLTKRTAGRQIRGTGVVAIGTKTKTGKGRVKRMITVADKTKVTSATKALIDMGDLMRSFDVLKATHKKVDVGPNSSKESMKALYNDDRGDWQWGKKVSDAAFKVWVRMMDKKVFR